MLGAKRKSCFSSKSQDLDVFFFKVFMQLGKKQESLMVFKHVSHVFLFDCVLLFVVVLRM